MTNHTAANTHPSLRKALEFYDTIAAMAPLRNDAEAFIDGMFDDFYRVHFGGRRWPRCRDDN